METGRFVRSTFDEVKMQPTSEVEKSDRQRTFQTKGKEQDNRDIRDRVERNYSSRINSE